MAEAVVVIGEFAAVFDTEGSFDRVADRWIPMLIQVSRIPDYGPPIVSFRIEVRDGVPVCTELQLSAPDSGHVGVTYLRNLHLDDLVITFSSECSYRASDGEDTFPGADINVARRSVEVARRGRRRKLSPELLAEVADIYRVNINDKPLQHIRARFGVSERTAARYVQHCRPRNGGNLLPDTNPGRKKA